MKACEAVGIPVNPDLNTHAGTEGVGELSGL